MTDPSTRPDNTSDGPTMAGGPYLGGPGTDAGYTAGLPRPGHADEIPDSDDAAKDTIAAAGPAPASAATTPATDAARESDAQVTNTGEPADDEPGVDLGAVNPS